MTRVWALAALWLGLALIASLLSIWFRISTALSEIVVGTIAQLIIGAAINHRPQVEAPLIFISYCLPVIANKERRGQGDNQRFCSYSSTSPACISRSFTSSKTKQIRQANDQQTGRAA
jgi:hypothetical protein